METRRPILVTGSHRSGSTWVGRMLAAAPGVVYVHEPFNVTDPPGAGICRARFRYWYTYVTSENEAPYYEPLRDTVGLRFSLGRALRSARSVADMRRIVDERVGLRNHMRRGSRALLKDPLAFFSAEWLAARFDMDVVVVVRHPAAFASSLMRLNWSHPFDHFLRQPLLMAGPLRPFEDEIRAFAASEHAILDQAILLWRMIHTSALRYRDRHPDWILVRHEDLSREPEAEFGSLYERLDLELSGDARSVIEEHSSSKNPGETDGSDGSAYTIRRDSRTNVTNWKRRLTGEQIERIRAAVSDVSGAFYADEDW